MKKGIGNHTLLRGLVTQLSWMCKNSSNGLAMAKAKIVNRWQI